MANFQKSCIVCGLARKTAPWPGSSLLNASMSTLPRFSHSDGMYFWLLATRTCHLSTRTPSSTIPMFTMLSHSRPSTQRIQNSLQMLIDGYAQAYLLKKTTTIAQTGYQKFGRTRLHGESVGTAATQSKMPATRTYGRVDARIFQTPRNTPYLFA